MRYLIISDIHGNWEGLQAVLADAGPCDRIICCGDLVGYGADPNAVVEWCRANLAAVVRGNHDRACVGLDDLEWFNPVARAAAVWTCQELTPENAGYIRELPRGPIMVDNFQLAHGSPLDEDEYLMDDYDATQVFDYTAASTCFFGHTHVQGGFVLDRGRVEKLLKTPQPRQEVDFRPDCYYLLNPGSVGQPRDGDPRTAYVIYDTGERFVTFARVAYDVKTAQQKIRRAGLPPILAERLAAGR